MRDFPLLAAARGLLGVAGLVTPLVFACPAAADDCGALARQLKKDALDQFWGAVLEDADKLLACDRRGPTAQQARFYRARALERLKKRAEAVEAYRDFLGAHCRSLDAGFLCEDGRVSMIGLLGEIYQRDPSEETLAFLIESLDTGDSYTRIFTAIEISKLRGAEEAKKKALVILVEAYRLEDDADFRNEICLAIIRIDPSKCGEGTATRSRGEEPKFIRARVYDCKSGKEKVKVDMPFSFARAVIESLGPELLDEIKDEGFDIENLWESLKKMDPEQKFQFKFDDDRRCEEVEVWFE